MAPRARVTFDGGDLRRSTSSMATDGSIPVTATPADATSSSTRPVPHPSSRTGEPASTASRV